MSTVPGGCDEGFRADWRGVIKLITRIEVKVTLVDARRWADQLKVPQNK